MKCVRDGLAALDDVLPRELQRDLHRLRSAADERDAAGAEARRRVPHEPFREGLRRRVREERRVRVFELRRLPRDRRDDAGMAVPEARHGGAARRIEDASSVLADEPAALAGHRHRWRLHEVPVQYETHVASR